MCDYAGMTDDELNTAIAERRDGFYLRFGFHNGQHDYLHDKEETLRALQELPLPPMKACMLSADADSMPIFMHYTSYFSVTNSFRTIWLAWLAWKDAQRAARHTGAKGTRERDQLAAVKSYYHWLCVEIIRLRHKKQRTLKELVEMDHHERQVHALEAHYGWSHLNKLERRVR